MKETESILPEWEFDEAMIEQFHQLLPSVAMMAIAAIPFAEVGLKRLQVWLNKSYPETSMKM